MTRKALLTRLLIACLALIICMSCGGNKANPVETGYNSCVEFNKRVEIVLGEYKITRPKVHDYKDDLVSPSKEGLRICIQQKKEYSEALKKNNIPLPEDKGEGDIVAGLCGDCGTKLRQCGLEMATVKKENEESKLISSELKKFQGFLKECRKKSSSIQTKTTLKTNPAPSKATPAKQPASKESDPDYSKAQTVLEDIKRLMSTPQTRLVPSKESAELSWGVWRLSGVMCELQEVSVWIYPCKKCKAVRRIKRINKKCAEKSRCFSGAEILVYEPDLCVFGMIGARPAESPAP